MSNLTTYSNVMDSAIFSQRLRKVFLRFSRRAVAILDVTSMKVVLCTDYCNANKTIKIDAIKNNAGDMISCRSVTARDAFSHHLKLADAQNEFRDWRSFVCQFERGMEDIILLEPLQNEEHKSISGLLFSLWPVMREDCLADLQCATTNLCEDAMLWMIANRIDVAVMIMNVKGQMLRSNAAATQSLEQELVLCRSPHGIRCVTDSQTRDLHAALNRCAESDPTASEVVVFLSSSNGQKVPLTLTRYWHGDRPTDLIAVMMPSPPNSHRIEMLARAGGLTPAEARVASLLQMGLSNKDAARVSGLKEQSISTYAKRALSKLNVNSRAEMAQMLTWQAAGGHM